MFSQKSTDSLRTGSLGFPWFETHRSIRRRFPGGRVLIASHRAGNASVLSFFYIRRLLLLLRVYIRYVEGGRRVKPTGITHVFTLPRVFSSSISPLSSPPSCLFPFLWLRDVCECVFFGGFCSGHDCQQCSLRPSPSLLLVALLTARSIVQHRKSDPFIFAKVLECPHWKPGASLAKGSLQFSFRYIDCIQLFFIPFFSLSSFSSTSAASVFRLTNAIMTGSHADRSARAVLDVGDGLWERNHVFIVCLCCRLDIKEY